MGLQEILERRLFYKGWIRSCSRSSSRFTRIQIEPESPNATLGHYEAGQHVRVKVGDVAALDVVRNDVLRAYSIWTVDREQGSFELQVFGHASTGPGARWADHVEPGDTVLFRRPEGKLVMRAHRGLHVFFGEETASVAFGAIIRSLHPSTAIWARIEIERDEDALPLIGEDRSSSSLVFLRRGQNELGSQLLRSVDNVPMNGGPKTAYIAGEAKTCKAIRSALRQRGWSRSEIVLKPFWTPGAKGLE